MYLTIIHARSRYIINVMSALPLARWVNSSHNEEEKQNGFSLSFSLPHPFTPRRIVHYLKIVYLNNEKKIIF